MKIILATNNEHKLSEIRSIFDKDKLFKITVKHLITKLNQRAKLLPDYWESS